MKKEITMWERPYDLGTFGRNVQDYGLASSLKHDLNETRKNMNNRLESIADNAFFVTLVFASIGVMAYTACRVMGSYITDKIKGEKQTLLTIQK